MHTYCSSELKSFSPIKAHFSPISLKILKKHDRFTTTIIQPDFTVYFYQFHESWNQTIPKPQILFYDFRWYVDSLPIRVFRNYENQGIAYPNKQGMRVYSSLWNADNWATRGGLVKIDWTSAPFTARFRNFRARACKWNGDISISQCGTTSPANWWTSPIYSQLSSAKQGQLQWVRDNFMIYDYCKDTKRFNGQIPPECFMQQF